MSDTNDPEELREHEIARNEEKREAASAIRLSGWAIILAVVVIWIGWILLSR